MKKSMFLFVPMMLAFLVVMTRRLCRRGGSGAAAPVGQGRHSLDDCLNPGQSRGGRFQACLLFTTAVWCAVRICCLIFLMQVFTVFSLCVVLWVLYGYSLAFTEGNAFFGGFSKILLKGVTVESSRRDRSKGVVIPELIYVFFQATFAAITPCPNHWRLCRADEVFCSAGFYRPLVYVRLSADGTYGLVLGGSDAYTMLPMPQPRQAQRQGFPLSRRGVRSTLPAGRWFISMQPLQASLEPSWLGKG